LLWAEASELIGDAAVNFRILQKTAVPIEIFGNRHDAARLEGFFNGAAWIVDGLLGTGARGEPRPPLDAVIDQLNAASASKLAIDVPSGLDCDTGEPSRHTIRAAETCTFVTAKPGFLLQAAAPFIGRLHVLDIGQPRGLVEKISASRS
jgi:NAD(P)H-hydrate epimerase